MSLSIKSCNSTIEGCQARKTVMSYQISYLEQEHAEQQQLIETSIEQLHEMVSKLQSFVNTHKHNDEDSESQNR